jgi:hypothetical protein
MTRSSQIGRMSPKMKRRRRKSTMKRRKAVRVQEATRTLPQP